MVAIFNFRAYNFPENFIGGPQNETTKIYSGVNMNIRYGTLKDAKMLSDLGARAFYDTFAKDNTPENMEAYLKRSFSPEIQFDELSEANVIFLIAEMENKSVGYAQLILDSRYESLKPIKPLEIRRMYASQEYIGKGVGNELMKAAISEARERGCNCIWLDVWKNNPRAIRFYKKWGFMEVGTQTFLLGDDLQNDFIMELVLD